MSDFAWGNTIEKFNIKTQLRQELISAVPFQFVIEWIMKDITIRFENCIHWHIDGKLDGLDFEDDIAILSTKPGAR